MIVQNIIRYSISLQHLQHLFNRNRTLLIHHGLMGNAKNFRTISKHPNVSSYVNSYLIDCRNHGKSPHTPTHTISDLAHDLHSFIMEHKNSKQSNWNRLTLMGHSMGGMALMQFTKLYPQMQDYVDRIIIVDISTTKIDGDPKWQNTQTMLTNLSTIPMDTDRQQIFTLIDKYANSPQLAGLFKSDIEEVDGKYRWKCNLHTLVGSYGEIGNYELRGSEWRKPVEVIYGSESNHVNANEIVNFQKVYPQMSEGENFHRVQGAGHWVHFDKPIAFLQRMKVILSRDE